MMLRTYEALLQPDGRLQFLEAPAPDASRVPRRVLVTFTGVQLAAGTAVSGAHLSEPALAEDWLREDEEAAWTHLQRGK